MLLTEIVLIIVIILIMILMMKITIMMMIIVKSDSKLVRIRVIELDSIYRVFD